MNQGIEKDQIDIEWVKLIKQAKALGFTTEDIRHFLTEFEESSVSL